MGGSSFDLLMQEVLNQKRHLDELVEENQNLQRQLADLRAGRGILLGIGGQQFTLNEIIAAAAPGGVEMPVQEPVHETAKSAPFDEATTGGGVGSDTFLPQSEQPEDGEVAFLNGDPSQEQEQESEQPVGAPRTTFLEDLLVDEFASAATSPMLAWRGPAATEDGTVAASPAGENSAGKKAAIDEEAKAALRRELIGSFLLE
jgi:hypothetical protein